MQVLRHGPASAPFGCPADVLTRPVQRPSSLLVPNAPDPRTARPRTTLRLVALVAVLTVGGGTADAPAFGAHEVRHDATQATTTPLGANFGWASTNWSGYAVTAGPYTSVTGAWTVPTFSPSATPTYSSSWVGIDGFRNRSLIQVETAQDYSGGTAHYSAWWEILPAATTPVTTLVIHPGDRMSATIAQDPTGGMWTITLANTTTGESFETVQAYDGPGTSAEWIQEAPTVGSAPAPLGRYGVVTFRGTANGRSPGFTVANAGVMV